MMTIDIPVFVGQIITKSPYILYRILYVDLGQCWLTNYPN